MPRHPDSEPRQPSPLRRAADQLACGTVESWLEPYADGELAPREAQRLEQHLASCAGCAEALEEAREIASALRALPELSCPPNVTAAVLAQAHAEVTGEVSASAVTLPFPAGRRSQAPSAPGGAGPKATTSRGWRAMAVAASLVAALGTAVLLYQRTGQPAGSDQTGARTAAGPTAAPLTPEELERTEIKVKLALAYLSEVGRDAGTTVRDEMVDNLFAPTHRALR